jgi:hypothetical protein
MTSDDNSCGNDYDVGISHPSSIILIVMFTISVICSIAVVADIARRGAKTSSLQLIYIQSISSALSCFAKAPFIYGDTSCVPMLTIFYYTYVQSLLIVIIMLLHTNVTLLVLRTSNYDAIEHHTLDRNTILFIVLFPIIGPIYPLVTHSFAQQYAWCTINCSRKKELYSSHALFWCFSLISFAQIFIIVKKTKSVSSQIFDLMKKEILHGAGIYAIVTMFNHLITDLIVLYSVVAEGESARVYYYCTYTRLMMHYLLPIAYAMIYYHEREYLSVSMHLVAI